jgi:hypothetical protein
LQPTTQESNLVCIGIVDPETGTESQLSVMWKRPHNTNVLKVVIVYIALPFSMLAQLTSCMPGLPGRIIGIVDTKERYLELRTGNILGGHLITQKKIKHRPELGELTEVHGTLEEICSEIHGWRNPRIVVESRNKDTSYQVVHQFGDREALKSIATFLHLEVVTDEREVEAVGIRTLPTGHRLKPAVKGRQTNIETVLLNADGTYTLDGVTLDELARFVETQCRRPVVNLTGIKGRWQIRLERRDIIVAPDVGENRQLRDSGLELKLERLRIPATVVRDKK